MSSIACYLQANSRRTQYLKQTIESINRQDVFCEKHIHIYTPSQLASDFYDLLYTTGWHVSSGNVYRVAAFKEMIQKINADYIFYIEDDIELLDFPLEINTILELTHNDRKCGLLSMNLGGSTLRYPHCFGDFPNAKQAILFENDKVFSFVRKESLKNDYFFEFPCLLMNRQMLLSIVPNIQESQIEIALSIEFDKLKSEYYKASICKPTVIKFFDAMLSYEFIPNFDSELETVKFYRILDPNQGGILNGNY